MHWPTGVDHVHFASIDSTNKEARRRASDITKPIWISADQQTAGVGRRGHAWSTQSGNFAATLLLPLDIPPAQKALRSFVAIVALGDAINQLAPDLTPAIQFKWPNDLLLNGGKLSGILLESFDPKTLAIGIGVNTALAPESDKMKPDAFAPSHLGGRIANVDLLQALALAFERREQEMRQFGFAPIREAWLQRAAYLGQPITARLSNREEQGKFDGIDDDGQLILTQGDIKLRIAAAEIYF